MLTSLAYDGLVAYRRADGIAGRDAGRGARHAAAAAEPRRPHVRLHAAQGAALLGRHAGPAGRLPRVDGALPARHRRQLPRRTSPGSWACRRCMRAARALRPLARHRVGSGAPARSPSTSPRPTRSSSHKLTMPFAYVVPAGTPARAVAEPRAARHRPLPDRRVGRARGAGGSSATRTSARPPPAGGAARPDRVQGEPARRRRGPQHRGRRARHRGRGAPRTAAPPHHEPAPRQGARRRARPGRCTASRRRARVDVPQRSAHAVRRHPRPAGGQPRHRPRRARRARRRSRARDPDLQIVPPAFPGFEPDCPYTANPSRGGGWTAPDLDARAPVDRGVRHGGRARRRRRAHATAAPPRPLLRLAAARARLPRAVARASHRAVLRAHRAPGSRDQMGFVGWAADFMSPSSFIDGNFTCTPSRDPSDGNPSHLCNRGVTRAVARARAATGAGRRNGLGRGRSPPRRPRACRAHDQRPHADLRLEAGRQRHPPRAVDHAARPDVGALSLDSFRACGSRGHR